MAARQDEQGAMSQPAIRDCMSSSVEENERYLATIREFLERHAG